MKIYTADKETGTFIYAVSYTHLDVYKRQSLLHFKGGHRFFQPGQVNLQGIFIYVFRSSPQCHAKLLRCNQCITTCQKSNQQFSLIFWKHHRGVMNIKCVEMCIRDRSCSVLFIQSILYCRRYFSAYRSCGVIFRLSI